MTRRNLILKIFSIVPVIVFYNTLTLSSSTQLDIPIKAMIAELLFGALHVGSFKSYTLILDKLFYILLFSMLFGTYIYRNFLVGSEYLFSRVKDKRKWFYKKSVELVSIAGGYTTLFLATILLICLYRSNNGLDIETVKMLVFLWITITLFLTLVTLLINLLAIHFSSNIAFLSVYIVIMILITLTLSMRSIPIFNENPYLLLLNPVAAIILNMMENDLMNITASSYFIFLNGIVVMIGARYFNKMDIAMIDNESN